MKEKYKHLTLRVAIIKYYREISKKEKKKLREMFQRN